MAVNDLTFTQIATVLNSVQQQATGQAAISATNTSDFVAVAQRTLKTGYDPVMSAISQVLSKTIFANRPYQAKFAGLRVDNQKYGNHVRKLQTIDKPFENDARVPLTDGESVDMYTVNKPSVIQTNVYGVTGYEKSLTIFRDQLDTAFSSPDEFASFIAMIMQNATDQIEQAHENTARATIANLIGGCISLGGTQNVKLVTAWNGVIGGTDTWATIQADSVKFEAFVKWMFGYIETLCRYMTERSALYHCGLTTTDSVMRHTPYDRMKCYLLTSILSQVRTNVFSSIFKPEYLKIIDNEEVSFWQAIQSPSNINVKANVYKKADGSIEQKTVTNANVLGVIFDEEAAGYTVVNEWSASTPFNAKGGYSNTFWHFTDRYWNDFTENCVVLTLD